MAQIVTQHCACRHRALSPHLAHYPRCFICRERSHPGGKKGTKRVQGARTGTTNGESGCRFLGLSPCLLCLIMACSARNAGCRTLTLRDNDEPGPLSFSYTQPDPKPLFARHYSRKITPFDVRLQMVSLYQNWSTPRSCLVCVVMLTTTAGSLCQDPTSSFFEREGPSEQSQPDMSSEGASNTCYMR